MNNTIIAILVALGLFGVIALIALNDAGPPKVDFQEIVKNGDTSSTTDDAVSASGAESSGETSGDASGEASGVTSLEESGPNSTAPSAAASENSTPTPVDTTTTEPEQEPSAEEAISGGTESPTTTDQGETQSESTSTSTEDTDQASAEEEVVEEPVETITPPQDFVLHLLFDEAEGVTANDNTGHGNSGSLVNVDTLVSWKSGKINGGLFLDAQNDYVEISHRETLDIGTQTQSYTIGFWFYSSSDPGGEVQIIGKGGRSGPSPFSIRLNKDGNPSLRVSDGIESTTLKLSNSVTNGTWKHVTAVRDGSTKRLKMYIDGIERGGLLYDSTTKSLQNTSSIFINRYEIGVNEYRYHNFAIDDLRIYNRMLSSQEIADVVSEGRI